MDKEYEILISKYRDYLKDLIIKSFKTNNRVVIESRALSYVFLSNEKHWLSEENTNEKLEKQLSKLSSDLLCKNLMAHEFQINGKFHKSFISSLNSDDYKSLFSLIKKVTKNKTNLISIAIMNGLLEKKVFVDLIVNDKNFYREIVGSKKNILKNIGDIEKLINHIPQTTRVEFFKTLEKDFDDSLYDKYEALSKKYLTTIQQHLLNQRVERKVVKKTNDENKAKFINENKENVFIEINISSTESQELGFPSFKQLALSGNVYLTTNYANVMINLSHQALEAKLKFSRMQINKDFFEQQDILVKAVKKQMISFLEYVNENYIECSKSLLVVSSFFNANLTSEFFYQELAINREKKLSSEINQIKKMEKVRNKI